MKIILWHRQINGSLCLMHFDRDCCAHIERHAIILDNMHFCKQTIIRGCDWIHVVFCLKLEVCALCHFVIIWRTFPRTTEFELISLVSSGVCVPTGSRARAQSLLCMHWVRQFVYSNSQLFCLTAQANAIDESGGEFVVMWQRKDAVMRTLALLESEQHGNQMRMLLR